MVVHGRTIVGELILLKYYYHVRNDGKSKSNELRDPSVGGEGVGTLDIILDVRSVGTRRPSPPSSVFGVPASAE